MARTNVLKSMNEEHIRKRSAQRRREDGRRAQPASSDELEERRMRGPIRTEDTRDNTRASTDQGEG